MTACYVADDCECWEEAMSDSRAGRKYPRSRCRHYEYIGWDGTAVATCLKYGQLCDPDSCGGFYGDSVFSAALRHESEER